MLGVKIGLRCEHVHVFRKRNVFGGKICLFTAHLPFMVLLVSLHVLQMWTRTGVVCFIGVWKSGCVHIIYIMFCDDEQVNRTCTLPKEKKHPCMMYNCATLDKNLTLCYWLLGVYFIWNASCAAIVSVLRVHFLLSLELAWNNGHYKLRVVHVHVILLQRAGKFRVGGLG